jgi:hypothetical protein
MGYRGLLLAVSRVLSLYIQYKVQVGVFIEQNSLVHILCSIDLLFTVYYIPHGRTTQLGATVYQEGKYEFTRRSASGRQSGDIFSPLSRELGLDEPANIYRCSDPINILLAFACIPVPILSLSVVDVNPPLDQPCGRGWLNGTIGDTH